MENEGADKDGTKSAEQSVDTVKVGKGKRVYTSKAFLKNFSSEPPFFSKNPTENLFFLFQ